MSLGSTLKSMLDMQMMLVKSYIDDLNDDDLHIRPVPGANTIAWQLGHLIVSENRMMNESTAGQMPPLPEGFAARYTNETAAISDPTAFDSKQEYLRLMNEQRNGTLAALQKQTDQSLDAPAPEQMREFAPTIGAMFGLQANHWLMHTGQWVVVRRKLGRKPIF